ncbi:MAG TPA: MFS transporter [Chthonomonadaceae bacterium]|nr:MFS transporter [Chthonomonadaceae bacterium]
MTTKPGHSATVAEAPPPEGATPPLRLSQTVIALGFVSLFTDMSSEMAYPQVPIFLQSVLHAPAWVVGLTEGLAESTASLLRIVSGWFSDRWGRRKPLTVLGYSFGAISKPLMSLATIWPVVLLLRVLDRLGKGLRTAPRDALIAETTPQAIRGRAFGLHRAMDTTGAILGPLLGYLFLTYISPGNLRHLFLFAGLPGLLAILTLLLAVRERPTASGTAAATREALRPARPRWRDLQPTYRRFLWAVLIFNLGNSSDAFLILRARTVGFGAKEVLLLYAAFNVVEAALGYAAGRFSDRVGRRPLIIAGYFVFAGVYLGFGLAHSKAALWALFLLYGLYYTLTQGVQRAFAADLADPAQRATQIGAYHTVVGLALLPASLIAGRLFDWNVSAPFFLGAALAATGALLLLLYARPS